MAVGDVHILKKEGTQVSFEELEEGMMRMSIAATDTPNEPWAVHDLGKELGKAWWSKYVETGFKAVKK